MNKRETCWISYSPGKSVRQPMHNKCPLVKTNDV